MHLPTRLSDQERPRPGTGRGLFCCNSEGVVSLSLALEQPWEGAGGTTRQRWGPAHRLEIKTVRSGGFSQRIHCDYAIIVLGSAEILTPDHACLRPLGRCQDQSVPE